MSVTKNDKTATGKAFSDAEARVSQSPNPTAGQGNRPGPQPQPGPGPDRMAGEAASTQNPPRGNRPMAFGARNINSSMPRPMSRRTSGEVVKRYHDKLEEIFGANLRKGMEQGFRLLILDNTVASVGPLSSLLLCQTANVGGQYHTAVYTMLIEGSGHGFDRRTIPIGNGRNAQIDVVAGDVYNEHYKERIRNHVLAEFGTNELQVTDAGVMVIESEVEPEDDVHMRQIAFNASQACYTVMENVVGTDQPMFSVGAIDPNTERLTAHMAYASNNDPRAGNTQSATGMPVRSDINITTMTSVANNQSQNQIGYEEKRGLTVAEGYVDLVYSPPQQSQNPQQPMSTQSYYPRFVITGMGTHPDVDAETMELELLAFSTTSILTTNMAWAGVYRSRNNVTGTDFRDIGAIGFETNLTGDPNAQKLEGIDIKRSNFGDKELFQLISYAIRNDLIFSMDVEETGPTSWIHHAFIAAANGNHDAYRLIIDAANNLTMGAFANQFPQGAPIAFDDNNRIHLGYYVDQSGVRRDIRDLDYLAMLNMLGGTDPQAVVEWTDTFDRTEVPVELRIEKRAEILRSMLPGCNIKGYARRITFNPDFVLALNRACGQAGLSIHPDNMIMSFQGSGMRGNFQAGQYGVGAQSMGGMFHQGGNPYAGYGNSMGGFQGRFGGGW